MCFRLFADKRLRSCRHQASQDGKMSSHSSLSCAHHFQLQQAGFILNMSRLEAVKRGSCTTPVQGCSGLARQVQQCQAGQVPQGCA